MILAHILGKKLLANGTHAVDAVRRSRKREYPPDASVRGNASLVAFSKPVALRPDSRQRSHVFFARLIDIDVSAIATDDAALQERAP
jgi:hypothetical protein